MTRHAVTLIDERDGDGITSDNPGELFGWILTKRPKESGPRSQEFAILADTPLHPIDNGVRCMAGTYQFGLYYGLTEVR